MGKSEVVKKILIVLAILVVVRLVLMAVMPVFDPSEARYAAISANMARTGDYVVPHFTHKGVYQSFDGKPPLVFQAGALACQVLGVCEFAVRLFPFVSALLVLLLLYHAVRRQADTATASLAVVICASVAAFWGAAGVAMTDMSLTCCVAGALLLYRCFAVSQRWRYASGVAILLGAGMMVKGPVALALFGLPVVVDAFFNHRWQAVFNWRWLAVAPLFFLIATPWFFLVEQRNPGSVEYFFVNENFKRFLVHEYGDRYGAGRETFRGMSVVWALVATLPWSLVPLGYAARRVKEVGFRAAWREVDWRSFDLLCVLVMTAFWGLTSRVLLYYLFPIIPLFASWLARRKQWRETLVAWVPWAATLSLVAITGALVGGRFFSDKMAGRDAPFYPDKARYAYEFYHGTPVSSLEASSSSTREVQP